MNTNEPDAIAIIDFNVRAAAPISSDEILYAKLKSGGKREIELVRLKLSSLVKETVSTLRGSDVYTMHESGGILMVALENKLVASSDLVEWRELARFREGNFAWHICDCGDATYVQEYGASPTYIRVIRESKVSKVVSNEDVDPTSKHFHSIACIKDCNSLVATLGDGNYIKVAYIEFDKDSRVKRMRALYSGALQYVPVAIHNDTVVCGMDSAIVPGGITILRLSAPSKRNIFLRFREFKVMQFSSLSKWGELWIGGLGFPSSLVASEDLRRWKCIYLNRRLETYNYHSNVLVFEKYALYLDGDKMILLRYDEVRSLLRVEEPDIVEIKGLHRAFLRLKSSIIGFKRLVSWLKAC